MHSCQTVVTFISDVIVTVFTYRLYYVIVYIYIDGSRTVVVHGFLPDESESVANATRCSTAILTNAVDSAILQVGVPSLCVAHK